MTCWYISLVVKILIVEMSDISPSKVLETCEERC